MDIEDFVDGLFDTDNELYDAERWTRTLQHMVKVGVIGTVGALVLRVKKYGAPIGISILSATAIYTMAGLNDIWEWVPVDRDDTAPPKTVKPPTIIDPSDPPKPTPITTQPVPIPPPAPPPPIAEPPPPQTRPLPPNFTPDPIPPSYGPDITKVFRVNGRPNESVVGWRPPKNHHILHAEVSRGQVTKRFFWNKEYVHVRSKTTVNVRVIYAPVIT